MTASRFLVAQMGARMHYAVPRILHEAGLLERLFTDFAVTREYEARFGPLGRVLSRHPRGIPSDRITQFPWLAFSTGAAQRLARESARLRLWLTVGRRFCRAIARRGFGRAEAVYAYNSAALELFQAARNQGLFCVLEQTVAAASVLQRLMEEEQALWPGWEDRAWPRDVAAEFAERERAEWDCADLVIAGSEFVAESMRQSGASTNCRVVPYGIAPPAHKHNTRPASRGLNVLFCGAVGLRKGVPYLFEAARRLSPDRFEFRLVGAGASRAVRAALPRHCHLTGAVPRPAMREHYEWAGVFVLPSICEGSAAVCYEALAAGLPVITTPHAGSVIRDGIDGFIVPIRDPDAIAERLDLLASDPALRERLSRNAAARARDFTVAAYGERLLAALEPAAAEPCAPSALTPPPAATPPRAALEQTC